MHSMVAMVTKLKEKITNLITKSLKMLIILFQKKMVKRVTLLVTMKC